MSDSIVKVPKLPRSGFADGEQIADPDGNVWEYNEETKEWFLRGKFDPLPVVTEEQNGLVTPEIYRKLVLIQELIDKGASFDTFKLKSSLDNPYFFYFQSSDGLIKFIPEADNQLRIELDRARLYALLIKKCCVGPKGKNGPIGSKGTNGKPAANEVFKVPKIENQTTFNISTTVASPIDTPISLRIFDENKTEVAQFLAYSDGTSEFALIDGLTIDETNFSISYDKDKKILTAKITFLTYSGDLALWRYKARQRGPTGDAGIDGKNYLEIIDTVLEDNSLESKNAVVGLRRSGTSDLKYLKADINTDICVSKISVSENAPLKTKEYINQKYLASEITTRDCKTIGFFNLANNFKLKDAPEIELPSWLPPSGCGQKTRFNNFKYNWWDYLAEDIQYMFRIIPTAKPPEKCCEQEFWYCPSTGDTCGIKGSNGELPILEMPKIKKQDECTCDCENPIELELQAGGYVFPLLDATTKEFKNGNILFNSVKSVIDGSADRFTSEVLVSGPTKIVVSIDFAPEVCGGSKTEEKNCNFKNISDILTIASIKDVSGSVNFTSSDVIGSTSFPSTMEFTLTTPEYNGPSGKTSVESKVELTVNTNTTRINICRGYYITIAAMKVEKTLKSLIKPKETEIKLPLSLQIQKDMVNAKSPEELRKIQEQYKDSLPPINRTEQTAPPEPATNAPPTNGSLPISNPELPSGNQIFRFELEREVICPDGYRRDPTRPVNDIQNTLCFPIRGSGEPKQGSAKLSGRLFFNTIGLKRSGVSGAARMFSPYEITSQYKIDRVELVSAKHASENRNLVIKNSYTTDGSADIWYDDANIWFAPDWQGEIAIYSGEARRATSRVTSSPPTPTFDSQGI